jgi:uncharacterized protein (UPF0303 family)
LIAIAAPGATLDEQSFLRREIWLVIRGHDSMVRLGQVAQAHQ